MPFPIGRPIYPFARLGARPARSLSPSPPLPSQPLHPAMQQRTVTARQARPSPPGAAARPGAPAAAARRGGVRAAAAATDRVKARRNGPGARRLQRSRPRRPPAARQGRSAAARARAPRRRRPRNLCRPARATHRASATIPRPTPIPHAHPCSWETPTWTSPSAASARCGARPAQQRPWAGGPACLPRAARAAAARRGAAARSRCCTLKRGARPGASSTPPESAATPETPETPR
jgi:hypothetical protein